MSTDDASPTHPSPLPGPGQRIGDYVIEGTLGQGAMGVIYRVRHAELGIQRAIKFSLLGHDKQRAQRFEREALALARLDHPGVIRIHDYGLLRGYGYCVLDLVQGHDLAQELAERGPLSVSRSCSLGARVARALAHVHAQGIVHRDLKPANILLRGEQEPVLTDFGIARVVGAVSLTRTQAVLGTPHYMSPEQIVGGGDIGPPADVFALGVVLYEWLSGELPFEGESLPTLAARIVQTEPLPLRELRPEVPEALDRVVARMLDKDATRRPGADQVADWLEACARGDEPRLEPESRWEALRGRWRRRPWLAAGLAALVVAGLVGAGLAPRDATSAGGSSRELADGRHALVNYAQAARALRLGEVAELDEAPVRSALAALARPGAAGLESERADLVARLEQAVALSVFDRRLQAGELELAAAVLVEDSDDEAWILRRAALLVGAAEPSAERLSRLARALPSGSVARSEVWLQAARSAAHHGDAQASLAFLERVEVGPVLVRAAAHLRAHLETQLALDELERGDEAGVVDALRAVYQRDPKLGDEVAGVVVDAILERLARDSDRALELAETLARIARASPLRLSPRTADLFMSAARAHEREGDWAGMARLVLIARRADPQVAIGLGLRQTLALHGVSLAAAGRDRDGFEVILASTHAGLEGLVTAGQLAHFREQGLLDQLIADRPHEWAAYYWRAQAALDTLQGLQRAPAHVLDAISDDLRRAGEGADVPPELGTSIAAMALDVLTLRDGPEAFIARARELRASGAYAEPWDLAFRAGLTSTWLGRWDEAVTWYAQALAELEAFQAQLVDAASQRGVRFRYHGLGQTRAYRAELFNAQIEARDSEGAARSFAKFARGGGDEPGWLANRARLRSLQGRPAEAVEDFDRAIELARGSSLTAHLEPAFQRRRYLLLEAQGDPRVEQARAELLRLGIPIPSR